MTPTPTVSAKEKARGAQERTAFEQWAANEWQNSSPPDNAWKGWIARAQVANRAALSATEGEAEPVAWRYRSDDKAIWNYCEGSYPRGVGAEVVQPLYASPPSAPAGVKVREPDWEEGEAEPVLIGREELFAAIKYVPRSKMFPDKCLRTYLLSLLDAEDRHLLDQIEAYERAHPRSSLQPDTQAAAASAPAQAESLPAGADAVREALRKAEAVIVSTYNREAATASDERKFDLRDALGAVRAALSSAPAQEDVALQLRGANAVIAAIERAIPDWRSYRDLVDAVECKMAERRS